MTFSKATPDYHTQHEYQTRERDMLNLDPKPAFNQIIFPKMKEGIVLIGWLKQWISVYYKGTPGNLMKNSVRVVRALGNT